MKPDSDAAANVESLIKATQLGLGEIARSLGISQCAFEKRKRYNRLSRADRSTLVRIVHVLERAQRVLGDRARGLEWLKQPNRALYLNAPLALLRTKADAARVFAVLTRLEEGGFA